MPSVYLKAAATVAMTAFPVIAGAQTVIPGGAQAEAQARLVCGAGTVVNATYLPGGLLRVTCRANSNQQSTSSNATSDLPAPLDGTTLAPTLTGAALTVVVIAAIVGSEDATTTSSSGTGR